VKVERPADAHKCATGARGLAEAVAAS